MGLFFVVFNSHYFLVKRNLLCSGFIPLWTHTRLFLCVERNKCSSNVRTATGNQSGPHRGRSVQFPARFFITAPRQRRQHLRFAAPTFCSHYIWIKAIEWIDTSALASGRALKWRRTKRLFVYVLREEKRAADRICNCHRWSSEPSRLRNGGTAPLRAVSTHIAVRLYGWLAHRARSAAAATEIERRTRLFWWRRWAERFAGNMEP